MVSPNTKKIRVVLVEDDQNLQYMYLLKLEREGFEVETASDGAAGLELCKQFLPDIILLDLSMPIMTGAEMLEKLRQYDWGSDVRVIILTNISKSEAPTSLRLLNVDRYVVKAHYTPSQVVEVIHEILGTTTTPVR